ncbi:TPA: restriction endonuclease subunit S [Escherichia coli]|nr:restriction endonuclease subunit S [Escherichia coli]
MSAGKLPKGWVETQLENIVDILDSMRVPVNNSERQSRIAGKKDNELYPYFGATGEVGKIDDYIFDEELVALGEDGVPFFDGHKNKAYMLYGKTWVNNHAHVIRAISGLSHNKYLCHYLNQFDYHDYVNGGTRLKLTQANMRKLPVSLAPLAEQKIIAEKLDTLLAQVDSTKARLEQIPQILKRFRQAVLAAAMGGKFTTNAGITQSPLTIGYETSKTPPGWKWHKLIKLAQLESGHTPRKTVSEYWENGDVPWISLQDIRAAHGKKIYKTKFMPTQKGIDNSSARLLPEGTVCFSRDISVGYVTIMGKRMATTQHFANWICGNGLKNKYLMFAFMAAKQHLTKSGQGTTVKTIYMPALKELMILIPSLSEQAEIVRRVEQLFAYADTIEKQVNNALARVNNLTQSILAKAFRGELTAQWRAENPDLISGENSAAALLEKIKAERAASGGKKASRKKS